MRMLKTSGTASLDRAAQNALVEQPLLPAAGRLPAAAGHDAGDFRLQRGAAGLVTRKRVVTSPAAAWLAAALGAWLAGASCRTMQAGRAVTPASRRGPRSRACAAPAVRVGILVEVDRVSIGADSGLSVRARLPGEPGVRLLSLPRATFRPRPPRAVCGCWRRGRSWRRATLAPAAADELLQVDATSYRGLVEVRPAEGGTLTVVNVVNLEDYLRGVVPNELSPLAFPQLEALKAQAVAARTYALAHRGEYGGEGLRRLRDAELPGLPGPVVRAAADGPGGGRDARDRRRPGAAARSTPTTRRPAAGTPRTASAIFDDARPVPAGRGVPARALVPPDGPHAAAAAATGPAPASRSAARDVALLEALGVLDAGESEPARLRGIPADAELRDLDGAPRGGPAPQRAARAPWAARWRAARRSRGTWSARSAGPSGPSGCWLPTTPSTCCRPRTRRGSTRASGRRWRCSCGRGCSRRGPDNTLRPDAAADARRGDRLLAGAALRAGAPAIGEGELVSLADGQLSVLRGESAETSPARPVAAPASATWTACTRSASELRHLDRRARAVRAARRTGRVPRVRAEPPRRRRRPRLALLQLGGAAHPARGRRRRSRATARSARVRDLVPRRVGVSGRVRRAGRRAARRASCC